MTGGADAAPPPAARRRNQQLVVPGIVWRRTDFRESSRVVTVLTRDHGRLTGLAKGAHRPDSPFLGRLDFLNDVVATFSADRGGLRLLVRAELRRERRALREPARFLAANHLAWLSDFTLPDERPEPLAFDLLHGGLNLLERCPAAAIAQVVLGLELRALEQLGALPDLEHCAGCGAPLGAGACLPGNGQGLCCRGCAELPRRPVATGVLQLLRRLRAAPGRQWPELELPAAPRLAAPLPAAWLAAATEQRSRWRAAVFADG